MFQKVDSNVEFHQIFIIYIRRSIKYFLIMATNSSKERRIDKSYKIKYKALKELEKGTPHKDVARMFEVPKNTLSTQKKHKEKIYENYEKGLEATRVKPEKYVNKAVMKWLLIMRSENIPINGPMFKEKAQKFAEQLNLEDFHTSDGLLEKLTKRYTYLLLSIYFTKQLYNSVQSFSFSTTTYFSSAKNNKRKGTFIPKPSPPFMAFPSTLIAHECFLFAFKK